MLPKPPRSDRGGFFVAPMALLHRACLIDLYTTLDHRHFCGFADGLYVAVIAPRDEPIASSRQQFEQN